MLNCMSYGNFTVDLSNQIQYGGLKVFKVIECSTIDQFKFSFGIKTLFRILGIEEVREMNHRRYVCFTKLHPESV